MTNLDARGISCPEPLLMLKKAMKAGLPVTLLLDSKNAIENCENFAKKQGLAVEISHDGGTYEMIVRAK